jgi:hypothetical protein
MDKATKDKIRKDIDKSSIPDEAKVLYEMANATELMSVQIFERIKAVYVRNGYDLKENELLTGLNEYCKNVKMATSRFQAQIHPQIYNATINIAGSGAYDWFNSDTNELCQLVLLYIDRTARNNENYEKIFNFLNGLSSCGIFSDKDINRFVLNNG